MTATLDILTLNTWGFGWPLARDRKRRFGRIASHLSESRYDVVALQEMWGGARETLGETGLTWVGDEARHTAGLSMERSGLGMKVRHGLHRGARAVRELFRSFSHQRGWDRVKNKGFMAVEVPVGDHRVTVVNTHLQAEFKHARIRRSQLDEILEAVDQVQTPVVLCGDFNLFDTLAEDRAGHQSLERHGFRDASLLIDRPEATYLTKNPYVSGQDDHRFDRIYLRDGRPDHEGRRARIAASSVEVIVDHAQPMSDHEAVAARLIVTR
jgi:endonuclease/exonuclease/phosphatase family metal-dependent hydrolase